MVKELWPLLKRQDAETGEAYSGEPFDPDWDRYFEYERCGILKIWTARANGTLVGYVVCLVVEGLHHAKTRYCYADLFWLAPEWRAGWTGVKMLRAAVEAVRAFGVKQCQWQTNDTFDPRVKLILQRLGFSQIGSVMQRAL